MAKYMPANDSQGEMKKKRDRFRQLLTIGGSLKFRSNTREDLERRSPLVSRWLQCVNLAEISQDVHP